MPLTPAERQRIYRARRDADPEKRAIYLARNRDRWKREREQGKRRTINEMSESERKVKRKRWREAQARRRAAKNLGLDPDIYTGTLEVKPTEITLQRYRYSQSQAANLNFSPTLVNCKATQTPENIGVETEMRCTSLLSSGKRGRPRKRPHWEPEEELAPIDHDISPLSNQNVDPSTEFKHTGIPSVQQLQVPDDKELRFEESPTFNGAKYIVYESCLKQLFNSCPICSMPCEVKCHGVGTFVRFNQHCPHCNYRRDWKSQPVIGSTPIGDIQMSAAIYFTGLSFYQVEKLCKALLLQTFNYDTFREHARNYLEPAIIHKWKVDQQKILDQLQQEEKKIKVSGDMWTNSGQAVEYGCYTLTHLGKNMIVDLQLVQGNEVGRGHMKTEALKRCLNCLNLHNLAVDYILTDSCPKIQMCLKEHNIAQFCDLRTFERGLSKKLKSLSQQTDCTVLKRWLHVIKNHLYWSVASSTSVPERVAKWTSIIKHMQNIHQHQNPLYPMCMHPEVISNESQKWLQQGSHVLNRVEEILSNKHILEDIAKLSSNLQTYSIEAFHNLIQEFTPKNYVFTFTGMLCRSYLAAMHHNENTNAGNKRSDLTAFFGKASDNRAKTRITYNYLNELMNLSFDVLQDPAPFMNEMKTQLKSHVSRLT